MVEISLGREERNKLLNHLFFDVIFGISDYMDKINIDESEVEIKTDRFTFTLSAKRNNGS